VKKELKKPSDYPLFYFRLKSDVEKEELESALKAALNSVNRGLGKNHKKHTKGEVLKVAMIEGLKQIRRRKVIIE
jgi:hypothetical protein